MNGAAQTFWPVVLIAYYSFAGIFLLSLIRDILKNKKEQKRQTNESEKARQELCAEAIKLIHEAIDEAISHQKTTGQDVSKTLERLYRKEKYARQLQQINNWQESGHV